MSGRGGDTGPDPRTGDTTLFKRTEKIESGWRIVPPLIDLWSDRKVDAPSPYAAGSQGPAEADELLACDGRSWPALLRSEMP